ncbi:MAG: CBS domain-containing protein, partial [Planctomycetota bacterium]
PRSTFDNALRLTTTGYVRQINPTEHAIITNMLRLRETRVGDVMTPRTVVAMASHDATARETMLDANASRFSRLPISGDGPDDIRGQVLRSDLSKAVLQGTPERTVQQLSRPLHPIPDRATLMDTMHRFRETGAHMFLAVDEYGGTAGVITLEDVLETILGAEIVDETDPVADMRSLVSPLPPIDGVGGPPERASSDASGERPADGG